MSKFMTRSAQCAVLLLLLLGGTALWGKLTGNQMGMLYYRMAVTRLLDFPGAAWHRNSHCTVADAWRTTPEIDRSLAELAVRKSLQVLRKDGPFQLVRTPTGDYWIPMRDLNVLAETVQEVRDGVYEGMERIHPGDVVLDCGANVGVYTRFALNRGAKKVVSIELAPESIECLRRNFPDEIAAGKVMVYPKGVWNKDDELTLHVGDQWASTATSVVLDRGRPGQKVPLTTIDKLVAELGLTAVDFVKMDIEGAEAQALEGAVQTVRRFRPRLAIALEHRPSDPDRLPDVVRKLWPDYVAECGPCANIEGSIQPEVMFAHAR